MRQRYDTIAFVNALMRKRRRVIMLGVAGVASLGGLLAAYLSIFGAPEVATLPQRAGVEAQSAEQGAPPNPPPPATAAVKLVLAEKGQAWIDNTAVGKITTHEAQLSAGKHVLRTKMGTRMLTVSLTVKEGERYTVIFDPKKRKPEVKREP